MSLLSFPGTDEKNKFGAQLLHPVKIFQKNWKMDTLVQKGGQVLGMSCCSPCMQEALDSIPRIGWGKRSRVQDYPWQQTIWRDLKLYETLLQKKKEKAVLHPGCRGKVYVEISRAGHQVWPMAVINFRWTPFLVNHLLLFMVIRLSGFHKHKQSLD